MWTKNAIYVPRVLHLSVFIYIPVMQVGIYTDSDIENLIPLSEIPDLTEDVCSIFYDTLQRNPGRRPTALQLLGYPALVEGK